MKRTLTLMFAAIVAAVSVCSYAGTKINPSELPASAQTFISKYFSDEEIKKAEKEKGRRGMEYEVEFLSGAEIDFTETGEWKEIKAARGNSIPNQIIPPAITKYVAANFEGLSIVEISHKRGGYEVKLSNETELKLTEDAKQMPERPQKGNRGNRRPK